MANDFLDLSSRALNESVELFGAPTFLYKGTAYACVLNDVEISEVLMTGGLMEELLTIVIVSIQAMPIAPAIGETLFANGKLLRVKSVKKDECSFEIHCTTAAK